jgi:hypothetical protein
LVKPADPWTLSSLCSSLARPRCRRRSRSLPRPPLAVFGASPLRRGTCPVPAADSSPAPLSTPPHARPSANPSLTARAHRRPRQRLRLSSSGAYASSTYTTLHLRPSWTPPAARSPRRGGSVMTTAFLRPRHQWCCCSDFGLAVPPARWCGGRLRLPGLCYEYLVIDHPRLLPRLCFKGMIWFSPALSSVL